MSRIIAFLLIFFVTTMYIASASDFHFTFAGTDRISDTACIASGDCGEGGTQHAVADPDHCSHGSAQLVGMPSASPLHSFPEAAVTPVKASIYFSVVSAPPTTPPKA